MTVVFQTKKVKAKRYRLEETYRYGGVLTISTHRFKWVAILHTLVLRGEGYQFQVIDTRGTK